MRKNRADAAKAKVCAVRTKRPKINGVYLRSVNSEAEVYDISLTIDGERRSRRLCLPPTTSNTEFVKVLDRTHVRMRVWERGSGETLACGTGACAVAVACILHGYTEDTVTVHLLGGDLVIRWDRENNLVYMTGPATEVFQGEIEL